jgi:hypothetical protein
MMVSQEKRGDLGIFSDQSCKDPVKDSLKPLPLQKIFNFETSVTDY